MPFPPVHPVLDAALAARGYDEPTAVQSAVLQPGTEGRDLLVSARTGSGKTVAFGLAAAATLMPDGELPAPGLPIALAIAPTRELALQVQAELAWLYAGARIASCVGGMDIRREARALAQGCHIVVGTPGRLGDHLRRGNLDLSGLRVVVLDEADEMLDLGFADELQFILDAAPAERRTLLFSATIPHDIVALARRYQRDALRIDTVDRTQAHSDIEYRAIAVPGHEAQSALVNILRWYEAPGALVFCATREGTKRLHMALVERGFAAVMLSGELSQHDRTAALDSMRAGRARVGVCTDVAARGLDLPELDLVVHADLPTNPEILLHRSGRTGRAGRKGVCVLIVPQTKRRRAEQLTNAARVSVAWSGAPTPDEIRARDRERLLDDPMFAEPNDAERTEAEALLAGHDPVVVASALLRLYQTRLPPPESVSVAPVQAAPAPRAPHEPAAPGDFVQFRVAVGRRDKADPKWLVPLICRAGGVTKRDIGAIRVFDTDTRFEISRAASAAFAAATAEMPAGEPRITPAGDGPMPARAPFRPRREGAGPRIRRSA
jgi:ATP-dependent RNA helicase DeaD